MNILIPHSWLLEHLETKLSPEELADQLSLAGPAVEKIEEIEDEPVYDIEVTTNRVDAMSVRGIAREAKVILNQAQNTQTKLKPLKLATQDSLKPTQPELELPKIKNQPKLCPHITCLILRDIKQQPTPAWMARRLQQIGQQVHNAAVDITNYVTHELGHPIHAFDYDRLLSLGGEIIVKEAEAGQKFTTLDGQAYQTVGGEVIFENPKGEIIDLPAIKGTANTSINQSTTNILLWLEKVKPAKVRFASMTHNLRTMAAQLNEKDVDPHLAKPTLLRAVKLYQDLCQAQIASPLYDDFPGRTQPPKIKLKLEQVDRYLGLELPIKTISSILKDLDCQVTFKQPDSTKTDRTQQLTVIPPTFRPDLTIPADLIEEIARIYGYQRLPSQLMATALPIDDQSQTDFHLERKIKSFLANLGWQEIYSYSLVSAQLAKNSGWPLKAHLKLKNPLTEDKVYLRRSLLPSLAAAIDHNPQADQLSVFELANTYQPQKEHQLPDEKLKLGLVSRLNYRQVRGYLEALFEQFYLDHDQIKPLTQTPSSWRQAAAIEVTAKKLGTIGILKSGLIAAELDIKSLTALAKNHPTYQPLSKTMPIREDLTFTLKPQTAVGQVSKTIETVDPLITAVELKSIYQQNYTFAIEYHHPEENLEMTAVASIRAAIVNQLKKEYGAKLVGEV